MGGKLALSAIYILAVLGSFVIATIVNVFLTGAGINVDLSVAIALAIWTIFVAVSVLVIINLYQSIRERMTDTTVIHSSNSPTGAQMPVSEPDPRTRFNRGSKSDEPPLSYRVVLLQDSQKEEDMR